MTYSELVSRKSKLRSMLRFPTPPLLLKLLVSSSSRAHLKPPSPESISKFDPPRVEIPKFSGKQNEDPRAWVQHCENVFTLLRFAEVDECMKATFAASSLRGAAATWYWTQHNAWLKADPENATDWLKFRLVLLQKFDDGLATQFILDQIAFCASEDGHLLAAACRQASGVQQDSPFIFSAQHFKNFEREWARDDVD